MDVHAITEIFNAEMTSGDVHYHTRPQLPEERREWAARLIAGGYPVLVAAEGLTVIGFGALGPFHPAGGYSATATGSLYVARSHRRQGVARLIGNALILAGKEAGLHTIVSAVSAANASSLAMHQSLGFRRCGYFREVGRTHATWRDDVAMQLLLAEVQPLSQPAAVSV